MNALRYEKPTLKCVSLRSDRKVAANCWSQSANATTKTWFYDSEGPGYVSFWMEENCSGRYGGFEYHPNAYTGNSVENPDAAIAEAMAHLDKQIFTSTGEYVPDDPGDMS